MAADEGQTGSHFSRRLEKPWFGVVIPAVVLFCLAAWWAVLLPQAEESIFARVPVLDELYYLSGATVESDHAEGYFMSPLYPKLIAWTGGAGAVGPGPSGEYLAPAAGPRGIRLLQIACWLGIVLLLHLISRRLWADEVAKMPGGALWFWLPSLLFVLYRPASVFAVSILLELPLIFLLTLFLYLLVEIHSRQGRWNLGWMAAAGLVLGTAALLRGTVLVLLPVAILSVWAQRKSSKGLVAGVLIFFAGLLLPLLPASLHNSRLAGHPAGPTFNGGFNLFIGNSPAANGFYVDPLPGDHLTDPAGQAYLAQALEIPRPTLAQADAIWLEKALAAMREHPARSLSLWFKKMWLHLQAWEIDQLTPQSGWIREVPLLKALVVPYGLLTILGLAGWFLALLRSGPTRWLALCLPLLMMAQSLFFVVSRYRLALVPFLSLLALFSVMTLVPAIRRKDLTTLATLSAGLVMAGLLAVPWSLAELKEHWEPLAQSNEARRWLVMGQEGNSHEALEKAEGLYRAATESAADDPVHWLGLAVTLQSLENNEEMEAVLGQAILQTGENLSLRLMLVSQLLAQGRRSDALVQGQALLGVYPDNAETLHNVTVLLAGFGNNRGAMDMANRYFAAHPEDPRAASDLGVLLARSGDVEAARKAFLGGLKANPGDPKLMMNLELLNSPPAQK